MLARTEGRKPDQHIIDVAMMQRCIRLSAEAARKGEFPFAALVCIGDEVVAEATNEVVEGNDVTRHAEIVAISRAQKSLGRRELADCTLYSNVEPCVMCSFPTRETSMARVVFAISSPMMGGFSKWPVLRDGCLSKAMPEAFGPPPEIVHGLLRREAEKVWWSWNPLIWSVIKYRGCFGSKDDPDVCQHVHAVPAPAGLLHRLMHLRRIHRKPA